MYHNHYIRPVPYDEAYINQSTITGQNEHMANSTSILSELARLEAKLDILTNYILQNGVHKPSAELSQSSVSPAELSLLRTMTAKQHVTAQLLIEGWPNKEIAHVLGIGENTVKLHVRAVCKKVGTKTRGQAALVFREILDRVDPSEYQRSSGGIPIDWGATYQQGMPDPCEKIYRKE